VGGTNWREIHHKGKTQSVGGTNWREIHHKEGVYHPIGGWHQFGVIQSVGGTNLEWRIASTQGGRLHGRDGHASGKHHDGR
jgi:hypothetical protein